MSKIIMYKYNIYWCYMKLFLYILCQCLWGLPQMIVGGVMFLLSSGAEKKFSRGAIVVRWKSGYSASLGMFIFISKDLPEEEYERLFVHEFGHSVQSLILGPLYLPFMALPSMIWCMLPALKKYRSKRGISYYDFYTERLADRLGKRYFKLFI